MSKPPISDVCANPRRQFVTPFRVAGLLTAMFSLIAMMIVRIEVSIEVRSGYERRQVLVLNTPVSTTLVDTWVSQHVSQPVQGAEWQTTTSLRLLERYGPHFRYGKCPAQSRQLEQLYVSHDAILAGSETILCDSMIRAWDVGGPELADEYLYQLGEYLKKPREQSTVAKELQDLADRVISFDGQVHE